MMEIKSWMEQIIQSPDRYAIPVMTHPGIEMLGYSVREAVQNGEVHARAIKALSDKYPSKASTVIMDLTVEAEAFGCDISFPEEDMPHISGKLVDASTVERLKVPSLTAGRIPQYLKANRLAAGMIDTRPVLAGVIGPFSLAGRLFGMSEIMTGCYLETGAVELLLEKCTQFILSYATALKQESGCAGIVIAEPAAGLLSNDDCLQFSSRYVKRIIESVQDEQFMVVLHNCGNRGHCTDAMIQTGAAAYHFGNAANMTEALAQCPADVLVMGNIDPVAVLQMLPPKRLRKRSRSSSKRPPLIQTSYCQPAAMCLRMYRRRTSGLFMMRSPPSTKSEPFMTFVDYHIEPDELRLHLGDLLRLLQVPDHSPDNPVVHEATGLFGQLPGLASIRGGYAVYEDIRIDEKEGSIRILDRKIHPQQQICGYMKGAEKLALLVCTAGEGFTARSREYNKEGDYLKGFITDTMGSWVVERAMDLIQEKLENAFRELGMHVTNRYSPGYCNWPVSEQQPLFSLLPGQPCNIRLTGSSLMIPLKSVSGIVGIGKKVKKRGYACDICNNKTCIYRNIKNHH